VESEHDPSIATRAGYLFRTRKSDPNENMENENEDQSDVKRNLPSLLDDASTDISHSPYNRQLRSRSYLFRTKKDVFDLNDSHPTVAKRGGLSVRFKSLAQPSAGC
jgi:hypothetical protein